MSNLRRELSRIGHQIHGVSAPLLSRLRWSFNRNIWDSSKAHTLPGQLFISLTSYPPRFGVLHLTLKSLLCQTIRPDQVLLWIAEQDMSSLPSSVLSLQSDNLRIIPTHDIRSYKKIIPAVIQYPDAFIATADDDLYYRPNWLAAMVNAQIQHPGKLICHRVHRIEQDQRKQWKPYRNWTKNFAAPGSSNSYFPTSGAGVIYPPGSLSELVCSEADFLELSPHADDIWLYWMARMAGTEVFNLGNPGPLITWSGSQSSSLYQFNVIDQQNDAQIMKMGNRFGYPPFE